MTIRHRRSLTPMLLSLLASLSSTGCSLASLVEESNQEAEKTIDLVCSTCVELYPDLPECEDLFAGPYRDDECTVDALELDRPASRATLNCAIDAQKDYNACLEANLDCENTDNWAQCGEVLEDALIRCPALPSEVEAALLACF